MDDLSASEWAMSTTAQGILIPLCSQTFPQWCALFHLHVLTLATSYPFFIWIKELFLHSYSPRRWGWGGHMESELLFKKHFTASHMRVFNTLNILSQTFNRLLFNYLQLGFILFYSYNHFYYCDIKVLNWLKIAVWNGTWFNKAVECTYGHFHFTMVTKSTDVHKGSRAGGCSSSVPGTNSQFAAKLAHLCSKHLMTNQGSSLPCTWRVPGQTTTVHQAGTKTSATTVH